MKAAPAPNNLNSFAFVIYAEELFKKKSLRIGWRLELSKIITIVDPAWGYFDEYRQVFGDAY